jgi:hypothetical protein
MSVSVTITSPDVEVDASSAVTVTSTEAAVDVTATESGIDVTVTSSTVAVEVSTDVDITVSSSEVEVTTVEGVSTFIGLTDTPNAYTAQAGKVVAVKSDESGLEFLSSGGGGGTPGGSDTQVQFNDGDSFSGDAGLTYADRELTIAGDTNKTTPLLTARSGDFHATGLIDPGIPQSALLYTAVNVGTASNAIVVHYDAIAPNQLLAVAVVGSDVAVLLATDAFAIVTSTANDVLAAVNGDVSASLIVLATLAPGNDGSGLVSNGLSVQLSGGASAADTAWIDERGVVNIQLQTGLGFNAINVRNTTGAIVAHIDNDGGLEFSSGAFALSQAGNLTVDSTAPLPLAGNATFRYAINGFGLLTVAAGGGYGVSIGSPVATDIVLSVAAASGQTGDLFVAFDENFIKVARVLPMGAIVIAQHSAPADVDIATGQMALWFDQTPGAAKFMIKGKDSDGTVVTGEVALTS